MQFKLLALAAFASVAVAQFNVCFDDGDCLLAGGGHCTRSGIAILGSCASATGGGLALPTDFALPTGLALPTGFSLGSREAEAEAAPVEETQE